LARWKSRESRKVEACERQNRGNKNHRRKCRQRLKQAENTGPLGLGREPMVWNNDLATLGNGDQRRKEKVRMIDKVGAKRICKLLEKVVAKAEALSRTIKARGQIKVTTTKDSEAGTKNCEPPNLSTQRSNGFWIPKAGSKEKRRRSEWPTLRDRIVQEHWSMS